MGLLESFTFTPTRLSLECPTDFRFSKKDNQKDLFKKYWEEQIRLYGMEVEYQIYNYDTDKHDFIYGEHTTAEYLDPIPMVIGVKMNSDNSLLSKLGMQTQGQVSLYIPISKFTEIFGEDAEPKAGDLITLTEYGNDRPNGRGPEIFQITSRDDQVLDATNQLMGHFIWHCEAARFEASFEKNANVEQRSDQVYDNPFFGKLASETDPIFDPATDAKTYPQEITTTSKQIFDYGQNNVDTSVYGSYDNM